MRHASIRRLIHAASAIAVLLAAALIVFVNVGLHGNPWYRVYAIDGGSMEPTLSLGDAIVVVPARAKVEPGMILALRVGWELVTHRVVAVNPDGTFVTRGDANGVDDNWAGRQVTVEGQYVATVPLLGRFLPAETESEASFADAVSAGLTITVGPFPTPVAPPTPPECAGMTFAQVIVGTDGNDTIQAGNGGALVFGLGGDDTIYGGNGKDCLVGGPGNDILVGGNAKDVLLGGDGNDMLYGGGDSDVIQGGNGKDLIDGGDGIDACYGTKKDTFIDCETESTDGSSLPVVPPGPAPTEGATLPPEPIPSASLDAGDGPSPGASPSPDASAPPDATSTPDPADATPTPTLDPAGATPSPLPVASPSPDASAPPDATSTPDPADATPTPTLDPAGATSGPAPVAEPTASPNPRIAPNPTPTTAPAPSVTPSGDSGAGATTDRYAVLTPCPDQAGCYIYTVRIGDNLYSIANWFGVSLSTIYAWNPQYRPDTVLRAGQQIRMPPPTR